MERWSRPHRLPMTRSDADANQSPLGPNNRLAAEHTLSAQPAKTTPAVPGIHSAIPRSRVVYREDPIRLARDDDHFGAPLTQHIQVCRVGRYYFLHGKKYTEVVPLNSAIAH